MSELDDRLNEGRAAIATMGPAADLWARVVEHSTSADAAVLDATTARRGRRPSLWLAVAAVLALIALVGTLALRDDEHSIETVPVGPGRASTTTSEEQLVATFPIPVVFDLPDAWTLIEQDSFYRLGIGPISGLPQNRIEFVVPEEAADAEEALAHLEAQAPAPLALGEPIHPTIGGASATCMDVEAADDGPRAPLFHLRPSHGDDPPEDRELTLEEGAAGRVCVVDARGFEGEAPLVVLVQAPAGALAAFLEEAEALLDDLELGERARRG
jgi:hypothetical protein